VYDEFATGPFLYRVGDLLSVEERELYVGTSASTVGALLSGRPPAAILVGKYPGGLDEPIEEFAFTHEYQRVNLEHLPSDMRLYIAPKR
jgi:hypothetical protein